MVLEELQLKNSPNVSVIGAMHHMRIVAWGEIGLSQYEIAKKLGMTRATVQSILRKYNQTGTIENSQRSGRPPKFNARDLRFLNRIVTKDAESRRTPVENILTWMFQLKLFGVQ